MHRKDSLRAGRLGRLVACALATALLSPATPAHPLVSRFDEAVARTLPVTLATPEGDLVVRERTRADVTYSDGETRELFRVTWRGEDAVAVRHGDALRIAVEGPGRRRLVRFDAQASQPVERGEPRRRVLPLPMGPTDPEPAAPESGVAVPRAPSRTAGYTDLYLYVYVENGLENEYVADRGAPWPAWNDDDIVWAFFEGWIEQVTREHLAGLNVHLRLRRNVPGVTSRFEATESSLDDWKQRLTYLYVPDDETPRHDAPNRLNLLLVRGYAQLPDFVGIVDRLEGHYGLASVSSHDTVPSHEVGHLLGQRHDLATIGTFASGSPCKTTMWPRADSVFCYRFSPDNIEAARETEARLKRFSE